MTISNIMFDGPGIKLEAKVVLFVWLFMVSHGGKKVQTRVSPLLLKLLLLCLDDPNDLFAYQRNNMILMDFALMEAQIPLMFVITDEAIERKSAKLAEPSPI